MATGGKTSGGKSAVNAPYVVFNGGEIGVETINRVTLDNYAACAERQENTWLDSNGPMSLRPGFGHQAFLGIGKQRLQRFSRSMTERFILCLSANSLRVAVPDIETIRVPGTPVADILARPAVTAPISNGDFDGSLAGWTDISEPNSSAAVSSSRLLLNSDGLAAGGVRQEVTTLSSGTLHAVNIVVHHGPVDFRCGSTSGGDEYLSFTGTQALRTGSYSLAFTPTGASFFLQFESHTNRQVEVDSIAVADAGDMVLPTPWDEAMMQSLRFEQSQNVLYAWSDGSIRQQRIERWDNNSWSIVETTEEDGPFMDPNTDPAITITPSVRTGNGAMAASKKLFRPGHVGSLWQLVQEGQFATRSVSGENQWTDPILVQGVTGARAVTCAVDTADLYARVRLQMSIGNTTSWADAATNTRPNLGPLTSGNPYADITGASDAFAFNDGRDNQTVYFRAGIKSGEYTSGSGTVSVVFGSASTKGVVKITNYIDAQNVLMEVLKTLAGATPTDDWREGSWSDYRGWPRCGNVFDGRLWTARDDKFWGSYSDAYESYLIEDTGGASNAIARTIAVGQANTVSWMAGLSRLIIGTAGSEVVVRSDALDSPMTTTNMTVRELSTFGVADVQQIKVDTRALFVDVSNHHLMEIVYDVKIQDYVARPLTTLHRDIGRPGITQVDVVRRPDTRVVAVRADGQLLVKLFDPSENVLGWGRFVSPGADGFIESVCALPSSTDNQDELYVSVRRTVNGIVGRYLEKLGPLYVTVQDDACRLDAYVRFTYDVDTSVITGLDHLEGLSVQAFGDGADLGLFVVSGGQVTLPKGIRTVVVGLDYEGFYKSTKLSFGAKDGTALGQLGRPNRITFILRNTMTGGVYYGQNFDDMEVLADRSTADSLDSGPTWWSGTLDNLPIKGDLSVDSRICIKLKGPGPAIIEGFVLGHELVERTT